MNFSSRNRFSLGQTFKAEIQTDSTVATPTEGFIQCPSALLNGLSAEQLHEIASIYQRAFEKVQEELAEGLESLPLVRNRFAGDLDGTGWN
jgi:hypothetical protein